MVGATGILIAGTGLVRPNRPPVEPPPPEDSGGADRNPCASAARRANRIAQLDAARRRLEDEVIREFQFWADRARDLVGIYCDVQELWWGTRKMVWEARVFNISYVGTLVVSITYSLKKLGNKALAAAGRTAPPILAEPTSKVVVALQALEDAVTKAISVATTIVKERVTMPLDPAANPRWFPQPAGSAPPKVSAPKPTKDPWAEEMKQKLTEIVVQVGARYVVAAEKFNAEVAQWGVNRQQDLDRIRQELQEEARRWERDALNCDEMGRSSDPDYVPATQIPPVGSQVDPVTLQLPQVRTDFDDMWFMGISGR